MASQKMPPRYLTYERTYDMILIGMLQSVIILLNLVHTTNRYQYAGGSPEYRIPLLVPYVGTWYILRSVYTSVVLTEHPAHEKFPGFLKLIMSVRTQIVARSSEY